MSTARLPCMSSSSSAPHNQLHTSAAIVKIKMGSIFAATLFRSSELNRRGRVIIGVRMSTLIAKQCFREDFIAIRNSVGEGME